MLLTNTEKQNKLYKNELAFFPIYRESGEKYKNSVLEVFNLKILAWV